MPVFTFRLDDDIAQRFDAVAESAGGRSVLLRRLVMNAVDAEEGERSGPVRRRERATRRFEIRLTDAEIAALDAKADALGMKRTDWVTRLVRCRLHSAAPLPLEERAAVAQALRELNRIGINLNQATRAANASVQVRSGPVVAPQGARAGRKQRVRGHVGEALTLPGCCLC